MKFKNIKLKFRHQYRIWSYALFNSRKIVRFMKSPKAEGSDEITIDVVPTITVFELEKKIESDDYLILDVRGARDFKDVHIEGSINIEFTEVLENLSLIPREKEIGVLCYGGGASEFVTKLLLQHGYPKVANIKGGIIRYALDVDTDLLELF